MIGTPTPTDATLTFSDITTNNASTTKHGFSPKLDGLSTTFLRGDGTWAVPPGAGDVTASGTLTASTLIIGAGTKVVTTTTTGTGVLTALGTNVGTAGAFVVQNGALGTPSSGTLTSCTGLPVTTGISGLGTGVATALAVNTGSAGAFVLFNGALGTPSSGTLTSCTSLPVATGISGLGTGVATALAVNTGSAGAFVLFNGAGGTPSTLTLTNATGLPLTTGVTGVLAVAANSSGPGSALPLRYLAGLGIANDGSDATNDIDIAVGVCRDSTDAANMTLSGALIKRLDANWAAGTNQGMRNSAAAIANGTYHLYLVSTAAGTTDVYAYAGVAGTDPTTSASYSAVITALQAETGGSGYIYARWIGAILRIGGAIQAFLQTGDDYEYLAPVVDVSVTNQGTSSTSYTISVPLGLKVKAELSIGISHATAGTNYIVRDPDTTDAAPSAAASPGRTLQVQVNSVGLYAPKIMSTNTSAQVACRSSATNTTFVVYTLGWSYPRGGI